MDKFFQMLCQNVLQKISSYSLIWSNETWFCLQSLLNQLSSTQRQANAISCVVKHFRRRLLPDGISNWLHNTAVTISQLKTDRNNFCFHFVLYGFLVNLSILQLHAVLMPHSHMALGAWLMICLQRKPTVRWRRWLFLGKCTFAFLLQRT